MTKPVTIPNTFATATTAIPLSQLDSDFSTVATALNDANTYSNYAADTGVANAYVVTLSGVSTTYSAGLRIQFKAGAANTGASTLNVNGGGTKNITFQDASALSSGTIAANAIVDVMYDGTQFLLMNDPAGATGGDVVGPSSATDNAIVRFDGATGKLVQNSVVTIADSTGDISGVGTLNATTLDATNIEVTNIKAKDGTAAASIADSTGVISVTANPVLSGGTANGVLYLNGSKVATSGSALTFDGTNLGLGSSTINTYYDRTQQIYGTASSSLKLTNGTAGTANTDGFDVALNGTTALLYNRESGDMAFGVNNTEGMRLTSTGLGIGTSSPNNKLEVVGGSSTATTVLAQIRSNGAGANTGSAIKFLNSTDATSTFGSAQITALRTDTSTSGDTNLLFATSNGGTLATKATLDYAGNLGLGVTPSAWGSGFKALETQSGGNSIVGFGANDIAITSGGYYNGGWKYGSTNSLGASAFELYNGSFLWYQKSGAAHSAGDAFTMTQAMTLDASGNLGVGATSPGAKLEISVAGTASYSSSAAPTPNILLSTTGAANSRYTSIGIASRGTSGQAQTNYISSIPEVSDGYSSLTFSTYGNYAVAERARITSGGYFKASNTGTYQSSTSTYHELRSDANANTVRISNTIASGYTDAIAQITFTGYSPNTTNSWFLFCNDSTATRAEIRSNGGLANYQSNNVDLSDARTKKDITPAPSYWNKIAALEIVTYKYNDQTHDDINVGVIAQQVESVEPVWVDADGFGKTPEDGVPLKTVYTKDITFAAIKALQEAMARIETLEAKVSALEGN